MEADKKKQDHIDRSLEKVREIPERTIKIFQYPRKTRYEIHIRKTPEEDASDSKEKQENIKKNSKR